MNCTHTQTEQYHSFIAFSSNPNPNDSFYQTYYQTISLGVQYFNRKSH